jgi:hypothetical protein
LFVFAASAAFLGGFTSFASAVEQFANAGDAQLAWSIPVDQIGGVAPHAVFAGANYSNVTGGGAEGVIINGSAQTQGTNTITKLIADDCTPVTGGTCWRFTFAVVNTAQTDVTARPRLRWYADNAGLPGTAIQGISFNPITFPANTVSGFFTELTGPNAALQFALPNGKFWAGMTFDDNNGTTGSLDPVGDMNSLGMFIENPVSLGSSQDLVFRSTNPGSNFVNNPSGATETAGGNPPLNLYWEFVVPEPTSMAILGLGAIGLLGRRRD